MEKTPKQIATAVAKAISDVRRVIDALPVMKDYDFFVPDKFYYEGFNQLVTDNCKKQDISEEHVRRVAGWNSKKIDFESIKE
jgi:hypothetical protein